MKASEYRMIRGSLDPRGAKENPVCTEQSRAEQRRNEATADRKASLIKDATGEGIIARYSHQKPNHAQVENCKMIFKYMLLWANKPMYTFHRNFSL